MAYHITIFTQDNTSRGGRHFKIRKPLFWICLMLFLVLPSLAHYTIIFHIMPTYAVKKAQGMEEEITGLASGVYTLEEENTLLKARLKSITTELEEEQAVRSELAARIAIAENARSSFANKAQQLEQEVIDLRASTKFYEDILNPSETVGELQCYNITTSLNKGTLKYGVNFLHQNQNNTTSKKYKIVVNVMSGVKASDLENMEIQDGDDVKEVKFKKSYTMKGSLDVTLPDNKLRMLDVRAYKDGTNELVGHCWKAF
ncbi:MAG: DUF6776 family protein [Pseudomonadota bacterium]|nr:DUF6776 family protein [Pseudomonadota bacterium]